MTTHTTTQTTMTTHTTTLTTMTIHGMNMTTQMTMTTPGMNMTTQMTMTTHTTTLMTMTTLTTMTPPLRTCTGPCTTLRTGSGTHGPLTPTTGGALGTLSGQEVTMIHGPTTRMRMTGMSTGETSKSPVPTEHPQPLRLISTWSLSR